MKVTKIGAPYVGPDPYTLPDQRFVHTADDGSITVEYPSAGFAPELNDLIHARLTAFYDAIDSEVLP